MPDTDATKTMAPPPLAASARPPSCMARIRVAEHDVEVPVPVVVGRCRRGRRSAPSPRCRRRRRARRASRAGVGEHALDVGAVVASPEPGHPADLLGDVRGEVGVDVDAEHARAAPTRARARPGGRSPARRRCSTNRRPSRRSSPGSRGPGVSSVRGHDAATVTVRGRCRACSSSGMTSVPSSSMVRMIDSCSRWPNCT